MMKLLRANFSRLIQNRLFFLVLLLMVAVPLYAVGMRYVVAPETAWETADGLWFTGGMYMSVVASVFISLFIGTEFSDGTIRNKLTAGHTRSAIYFSNLITCSTVSLFYHIIFIAALFGAGCLLLQSWTTPVYTRILLTALSLVTVIAMSAIFTMLAMLIHSRSAGAVTAMLVAMGMLSITMTIISRLDVPEFIDTIFVPNAVGDYPRSNSIPNPKFVTGFQRKIYQHILNLMPTGQMAQFGNMDYTPEMCHLPLYAVTVAVVCTVVGVIAFQRKDIQ